jgi:hypothetical protein
VTYFKGVSPVVAIRLSGENHTDLVKEYLATCCHFHSGCKGNAVNSLNSFCKLNAVNVLQTLAEGVQKKMWGGKVVINHYSRSLEKYALKAATWETSGRKKGYDILNFLDRNVGRQLDSGALRHTCQVRSLLEEITGEYVYRAVCMQFVCMLFACY